MFIAIFLGIPNSLIPILASGVITLRAEKSTRLPIRLPLTRPVLPFNRSTMDLSGLPERCVTLDTPGILLFIIVAM